MVYLPRQIAVTIDAFVEQGHRIVADPAFPVKVRAERSAAGNALHAQAAANYLTYNQQTALPQRLRLYALMQWIQEVVAANQPGVIDQARPQIEAALPQLTNYEMVLDLSRQIIYGQLGQPLAIQAFQRGQQLALQAFDACPHPSPAATILFLLSRRANDLRQYDAIINTWSRMGPERKSWLWNTRADFWRGTPKGGWRTSRSPRSSRNWRRNG